MHIIIVYLCVLFQQKTGKKMKSEFSRKTHYGHNVRRLRDMLGIKQEAIAYALDMTQQNFSILEKKPEIDDKTLEKIAEVMKIPVEAIKNFSETGAINIISSSLHDNSGVVMYNPVFNPLEKIFELYAKTLKDKDEEIFFLRNLLEKK